MEPETSRLFSSARYGLPSLPCGALSLSLPASLQPPFYTHKRTKHDAANGVCI